MGRRRLTLRIERLDEVALLTAAVEAVTAELGLSAEDAAAVQLSTVEAVNNAIEHAGAGPERRPIELTLSSEPGALAVSVVDRGTAIPQGVLEAAARCARAATTTNDADGEIAERGRGLVIIHRLMTEVRYATGGGQNALTMIRRLAR